MKKAIGLRVTTGDSHKLYQETRKESPVKFQDYGPLLNLFCEYAMGKVLEGNVVILPQNMGEVYMRGKKRKPRLDKNGKIIGTAVDFKATMELRKRCAECAERKDVVYHFNEHSDGVGYSFFWSHKKMYANNKELYYFKAVKDYRSESARLIKERLVDYNITSYEIKQTATS